MGTIVGVKEMNRNMKWYKCSVHIRNSLKIKKRANRNIDHELWHCRTHLLANRSHPGGLVFSAISGEKISFQLQRGNLQVPKCCFPFPLSPPYISVLSSIRVSGQTKLRMGSNGSQLCLNFFRCYFRPCDNKPQQI